MSFRRPPALANWLLDRLGGARRDSALAGDLLEEFRGGRSAAWYWRQTLVAVAHGLGGSIRELRLYLLAISAAYAVQFPVTLTLWSKHYPPAVHGSGRIKFGVWVLVQVVYGIAAGGVMGLVNRKLFGTVNVKLNEMFWAVDRRDQRPTIAALAACDSFLFGLVSYCLCALVFTRVSLAGLVSAEVAWFVLWVLTPALVRPKAPPAQAVKDERPWLEIPQPEPCLKVRLHNGQTVALEQQSLAQTVFAAGDPELVRTVFGRRRSLELLRRVVWLGSCRSESYDLSGLAALIDETARTTSVLGACYRTNRRESFRQRIRLWFCGDSA